MRTAVLVAALVAVGTLGAVDASVPQGGVCKHDEECKRGVLCRNGTCQHCTQDSQCGDRYQICSEHQGKDNGLFCTHKPLFPDFMTGDLLGTILGAVAAMIAAGGGIGGGGLYVPVFILAVGFSPHSAVPLSKAMVFGGAVANTMMNWSKRHPAADRPLIDYDVALALEPMTIAGTTIGVLLNVLLPEWLIVVLLCILLFLTTLRTVSTGRKVYLIEHEEGIAHGSVVNDDEIYAEAVTGAPGPDESWDDASRAYTGRDIDEPLSSDEESSYAAGERGRLISSAPGASHTPMAALEIEEVESRTPWGKIMLLLLVWFVANGLTLLRGGHGVGSIVGIPGCGVIYWAIFVFVIVAMTALTFSIGLYLQRTHRAKVTHGFKFCTGDVEWTPFQAFFWPMLSLFAGLAAGLFGIGGGMIKGPLMLEMGILAQTTAATAAFMILFTSSSTVVQFVIMGTMQLDYALWYIVVGFIATVIGQLAINHLVHKYRKTSYIIFAIAIVIGLSCILLAVVGGLNIAEDVRANKHLGFDTRICT